MVKMEIPLCEKWRPKAFEQVLGLTYDFNQFLSSTKNIPNLLLYGPQGTGKTTIAKILIEKLKPIDVLRINGSDTTGVDTIRDKVYHFVSSKSSVNGKPRIVWIEEFDFMSASAFAALRAMIEQFISNARFICTCNYINKIPAPIQSRFSLFEFHRATDYQEVEGRLLEICKTEGITVKGDTTLIELVGKNKGDIRATINELQLLSTNPEKTITFASLHESRDTADEVYDLLIKSEWSKIRYEIPKKNPDYNKILVALADLFFKDSTHTTVIKSRVHEVISTGMMEMSFSFDEHICFAAICSRIIRVLIGDDKKN